VSEQIDSYEGPSGDSALVRLLYPAPAKRCTRGPFGAGLAVGIEPTTDVVLLRQTVSLFVEDREIL